MRAVARTTVAALALVIGATGAGAQDTATLADIRAQLGTLYGDVQGLRAELSSSGALSTGVAGATPLDRLNAIEAELTRLTGKTEELEFRINRITTDGTNRIGDLEFRLCEIEEGCDIGALGDTPSLGGADSAANVPTPAPATPDAPQLAVGESQDFQRAQEALASGDFRGAADLLATFGTTYPASSLRQQAALMRGRALDGLNDTPNAARAYLEAFSGNPEGADAPEALFRLGRALGGVGQVQDACVTLSEVGVRFPQSPFVAEAANARVTLGCT
ncbi:tol-pal system protein YbgF [Loktanella fryxellensis]|uniref:Cell division coordinator CpoB n=1 Tax=Loktanella fryxellensis TaxID=245187 RepID=A0A1H8G154_9RHOB|nr:tetratricopeptide repeat protein [Loktanella fryxellensis]SEN37619.1 tol-pal system protein YbgF [Loktanella fryxellensis]